MTPEGRSAGQPIRRLPGRFAIGPMPADAVDDGSWVGAVRAPDGLTVFRHDDRADVAWAALWTGDAPHAAEATGMLSAVIGPLAKAGIPVMVLSTADADLVFVPFEGAGGAEDVLRAAGHRIVS